LSISHPGLRHALYRTCLRGAAISQSLYAKLAEYRKTIFLPERMIAQVDEIGLRSDRQSWRNLRVGEAFSTEPCPMSILALKP